MAGQRHVVALFLSTPSSNKEKGSQYGGQLAFDSGEALVFVTASLPFLVEEIALERASLIDSFSVLPERPLRLVVRA